MLFELTPDKHKGFYYVSQLIFMWERDGRTVKVKLYFRELQL